MAEIAKYDLDKTFVVDHQNPLKYHFPKMGMSITLPTKEWSIEENLQPMLGCTLVAMKPPKRDEEWSRCRNIVFSVEDLNSEYYSTEDYVEKWKWGRTQTQGPLKVVKEGKVTDSGDHLDFNVELVFDGNRDCSWFGVATNDLAYALTMIVAEDVFDVCRMQMAEVVKSIEFESLTSKKKQSFTEEMYSHVVTAQGSLKFPPQWVLTHIAPEGYDPAAAALDGIEPWLVFEHPSEKRTEVLEVFIADSGDAVFAPFRKRAADEVQTQEAMSADAALTSATGVAVTTSAHEGEMVTLAEDKAAERRQYRFFSCEATKLHFRVSTGAKSKFSRIHFASRDLQLMADWIASFTAKAPEVSQRQKLPCTFYRNARRGITLPLLPTGAAVRDARVGPPGIVYGPRGFSPDGSLPTVELRVLAFNETNIGSLEMWLELWKQEPFDSTGIDVFDGREWAIGELDRDGEIHVRTCLTMVTPGVGDDDEEAEGGEDKKKSKAAAALSRDTLLVRWTIQEAHFKDLKKEFKRVLNSIVLPN